MALLNPPHPIPVQLSLHTPGRCPVNVVLSATPAGRVKFDQTSINLLNGSPGTVMITPLAVSQSPNDVDYSFRQRKGCRHSKDDGGGCQHSQHSQYRYPG